MQTIKQKPLEAALILLLAVVAILSGVELGAVLNFVGDYGDAVEEYSAAVDDYGDAVEALDPWALIEEGGSRGLTTEGYTNFTSVAVSEDLTVGDDLTVTDDTTFTDDAAVGGDLTVTGDLKVGDGTPSTTLNGEDAYVEGTFEVDGAVNLDGAVDIASTITTAIDQEHIGLPTVDSAAIITSTDGALWTVGATEVWFIHALYCNVTTNFDCTGDDCRLHIGLAITDADLFMELVDAELQAADTEGTGAPAGWQGFMSGDTRGAGLAEGLGFVITNDTIDVDLRDVSAGTDPTGGAATCYLVYTRIQ